MVIFAMMNKYECSKMINNMAGYVYSSCKMARKRDKLLLYNIVRFNFMEFEKRAKHSSHTHFVLTLFLICIFLCKIVKMVHIRNTDNPKCACEL